MKGKEPPKQEHMLKLYDEYQAVGRTDVSDLLEGVIEKLPMEIRLFPDLYAHKLTEALIKAGVVAAQEPTPVDYDPY